MPAKGRRCCATRKRRCRARARWAATNTPSTPNEAHVKSEAHVKPIRRVGRFLRPYRMRVAGALAALLVAAGCVLALGQGLRLVIDSGFGSGQQHLLDQALGALLALALTLSV